MEQDVLKVEDGGVVQPAGMFDDMCPVDFEPMEIITIEHGVRVWSCTNPECGYIRPV